MSKKYIIYDIELVSLKWMVGPNEQLLVFDTEDSAKLFIEKMIKLPFFYWSNMDLYTTSVYPEIEKYIDCLNATNLIPVQNGDDVELKEVD